MKTRISICAIALAVLGICVSGNTQKLHAENARANEIVIRVSPQLTDFADKLISEYQKKYLDQKFEVSQVSQSGEFSFDGNVLELAYGGELSKLKKQQVNYTTVGRNVLVLVTSAKNPHSEELLKQGISVKELKSILKIGAQWGDVLGSSQEEPVKVFVDKNPATESIIGSLSELGSEVYFVSGVDDFLAKIKNEPLALGLCLLPQIADAENSEFLSGIKVLPIDKNDNGKIDYVEDVCGNISSFKRAIWIGKYPKEMIQTAYIVSSEKIESKSVVSFLSWVVTDGQSEVANSGLCALNENEQLAQVAKIGEQLPGGDSIPVESGDTWAKVLLFALGIVALVVIIAEAVIRWVARTRERVNPVVQKVVAFTEANIDVPMGLYFDKTHSWAFMRKDGSVKVGIDDFLLHITGEITRIDMKETGVKIRKGDRLCSIFRKGKVLHIYSPVTGTIQEINEKLKSNPGLLNTDPYNAGWIYAIQPVDWELELHYLLIAERFKASLKDEFSRLKKFLDSVIKSGQPEVSYVVLQDGGELVDHFLAELGPDVWEDFQTKFIDNMSWKN